MHSSNMLANNCFLSDSVGKKPLFNFTNKMLETMQSLITNGCWPMQISFGVGLDGNISINFITRRWQIICKVI